MTEGYAILFIKAQLLDELGRYEECLEAYEKAADQGFSDEDTDIHGIYHRKATIFIKLERYDDALCEFDKAVKNSRRVRHKAGELRQKAELLGRLNRVDEARQAYDIANNLEIEEGFRYYELARNDGMKAEKEDVLWHLGTAIKYYEKFKERVKTESAFEFLRDDLDFQKIIE